VATPSVTVTRYICQELISIALLPCWARHAELYNTRNSISITSAKTFASFHLRITVIFQWALYFHLVPTFIHLIWRGITCAIK
jgi:hypothetical protein